MKEMNIIILFFTSLVLSFAQGPCEDPDAISKTTPCGTQFDLCIDRYQMQSGQTMELEVFTNDMGMFDACESYICSQCSNGDLNRLANCNFAYTPETGFYGKDTFYYAMIVNDSCTDKTYCNPDDGKIWTIESRYKGPNGLDVKVYSKHGNTWDIVDEKTNLQNEDYFLIDGSHLPTSQANWKYVFSYPQGTGGCSGQECLVDSVDLHTSCSQQIMGKDFGYFRVISGCIATPPNKTQCQGVSRNETYTITSQWVDTTMVVITVEQVLAVDLSNFSVQRVDGNNIVNWTLHSNYNIHQIELEKSPNGKDFETISIYDEISIGDYMYSDNSISNFPTSYYRLKLKSLNGEVNFSKTIMIENKVERKIQLFPNPTDGKLTITINHELQLSYEYTIFSISGKMIYQSNSITNTITDVPLSNLALSQGTYFVKVEYEDGIVDYEKFIYLNK